MYWVFPFHFPLSLGSCWAMACAFLFAVIWGMAGGPGQTKLFSQEEPEPFHLEFQFLIAHDLAKHLAWALPFPEWIKIDKVPTSRSLQSYTIQTDADQTWPRQTSFEKWQKLNRACRLRKRKGWTQFQLGRVRSLFRKAGAGGQNAPLPSFFLSLCWTLSILYFVLYLATEIKVKERSSWPSRTCMQYGIFMNTEDGK